MKKFLIIGLGRFGFSLATTLAKHNCEVMVLDKNEENIYEIRDFVTYAMVGDCADKNVLKKIDIPGFDTVIVCVGNSLEVSIMTTVLLKELGAENIIVKGQSETHAKVLRLVGADRVVLPERDMGARIGQMLSAKHFLDYIELSPQHSIIEMEVPSAWVGKSILTLDVRKKFHINILAIKKKAGDIDASPKGETVFEKEDVIVVLGDKDSLDRL